MVYTATVTSKGQITIPKPIRDLLDLTESSQVAFVKDDEEVVVKPAVDFMALKGTVKRKKYTDKKADKAVSAFIAKEYAKKKK